MEMKTRLRILYVVIGVSLLCLVAGFVIKAYKGGFQYFGNTQVVARDDQPRTVTINKHTWTGVMIPPGKKIRVWSITQGVLRQVRVNKDPNRVCNVPAVGRIKLGDGDVAYMEWLIQPDQTAMTAEIGYEIVPDS